MRLFFLAISCSFLAVGCRSYPTNQKEVVELRQEILDWQEDSYMNESESDRWKNKFADLNQEFDRLNEEYDKANAELSELKKQNNELENDDPQPEEIPNQNKTGQSDTTQPRPDDATIGQVAYNAAVPTPAPPEPALKIKKADSISVYSPPTTGINLDKIDGDEGVEIFITPQDDTGETVHSDGELTVSLIDPTASPDRQRIGLWKFVSEETKLFFAKDPSGERGILLHLPWEQSIPTNSSLDLHVRLVTPDGRTLKTKHQLTITPPEAGYSVDNSEIRRWTREDARWLPAFDESEVIEQTRIASKSTPAEVWKPSKKRPAVIEKSKAKNSPPAIPSKPVWSPIRD